jgi:hypothetical protein
MHVFGAFELDIQPGAPGTPAFVRDALRGYVRGEDGHLFIPRSALRSRKWKGSSIPCKATWTRSVRKPAARSKSREASVRLGTAFLLDRWIVSVLPSEGLSHETCPVLLHSANIRQEFAANGRNVCA